MSSLLIMLLFLTTAVEPEAADAGPSAPAIPADTGADTSAESLPADGPGESPVDDRPATDEPDVPDEPASAPRVALDAFAREAGLSRLQGSHEEYRLARDDRGAIFYIDSRRLLLDGTLVWLNGGTARTNGHWHVSETDITTILRPWADPASVLTGRGAVRILLDAGHGGMDAGAVGGGLLEKDVVLDITRRVADRLRDAGETVLMTRTNDTALSLDTRTEIARREAADLFVSIHANQAAVPHARGIESFVLPARGYPPTTSNRPDRGDYAGNAHDAASTLLAIHVHRAMIGTTGAQDRGVKRSRFVVLRDAPCPAVLVECGFLSNPTEAGLLATPAYRDTLADGIADGIRAYLDAVRSANTATGRSTPETGQTDSRDRADRVPPRDGTAPKRPAP